MKRTKRLLHLIVAVICLVLTGCTQKQTEGQATEPPVVQASIASVLLIIDPQYDFIHGTLPVPEARDGMDRLVYALPHIPADEICVTMDCHTIDHISFLPQGGPWPVHCVKYSSGAAIDSVLFEALSLRNAEAKTSITFIEKGTARDKDEYSAFTDSCPDILRRAERIYVAGIAGDVCVHTTISDLMAHGLTERICVITDACPSLDGGVKLSSLIREAGLRSTTTAELAAQ